MLPGEQTQCRERVRREVAWRTKGGEARRYVSSYVGSSHFEVGLVEEQERWTRVLCYIEIAPSIMDSHCYSKATLAEFSLWHRAPL